MGQTRAYSTDPDAEWWLDPAVYESLLDLFARTEDEIADLDPGDVIDVRSFVWVVSKYRD